MNIDIDYFFYIKGPTMRFRFGPVKIGAGIFLLILMSVSAVLFGFWDVLSMQERATVAIGGVGALGTATLALATFWTIEQNEETLKNLERERQKAVILDMLGEVIDPIISQSEEARNRLRSGHRIWSGTHRNSDIDTVNVPRPPSYRNIEVSIWHEFEEDYTDLHEKCKDWWNRVDEIGDDAGELAEALYEADDSKGVTDPDKAVKTIMNETTYASGADPPVDDVEEFRRTMYRKSPELHHQYWRSRWELLKLVREMRSETIEMKRELQAEYGISNREITEYQNVS